ncbi:IclR family transcriptional regulator C-terminal domain-containing protein, partial [Pseudoalteromonas sp. SIMBA_162]
AQMPPAQRRRLLTGTPLNAMTRNTLTDIESVEAEIEQVRQQGFALDDEEFLPGLVCIAVLAPNPDGPSNIGVAIQAPVMRQSREDMLK